MCFEIFGRTGYKYPASNSNNQHDTFGKAAKIA